MNLQTNIVRPLGIHIFLLITLSLNQAFGLSVESRQWQAEVFNADFVGIVQCIRPGGDYRVVDAWKHSTDEKILKIHHVKSYHSVGKKFLVCVKSFNPKQYSKQLHSWDGFQSPFSWRVLPDTKYRGQFIELEYLEERRKAASQKEPEPGHFPDFFGLSVSKKNNFELKQEVQRFNKQSLESQEYDVLLASMKYRSARDEVKFKQPWQFPFQKKNVEKLISKIFQDADKIAKHNLKVSLSASISDQGQKYKRIIWPVFYESGIHTLKALANIPLQNSTLHDHLKNEIRLLSQKLTEEDLKQVTFYDLSPQEEFDALKSFVTQGLSVQMLNLQSSGEKNEASKLKKIRTQIAKIDRLNDLLRICKTENKFSLGRFFAAGGRETFKWLKKNSTAKQFVYEKNILACRLGVSSAFKIGNTIPSKTQLKQWENLLSGISDFSRDNLSMQYYDLPAAVEYYTEKKPAIVADYLQSFYQPVIEIQRSSSEPLEHMITQSGYFLASYFGHFCTEDRVKHLTELTSAKDPFVQAAAAIYLSFDQPELAMPILEEKTKLKGAPGAWAAFALVRRGHSEYMIRALSLFKPYPDEAITSLLQQEKPTLPLGLRVHYKGPAHELEQCLQNHLNFLQQKFNLTPPNIKPNDASIFQPKWKENRILIYAEMIQWWQQNKTIITDTRDPLINELIAQKID